MTCLKCGKETKSDHVFCDRCLTFMEAYPVKPGTPVHLPARPTVAPAKKAPRRRALNLEERFVLLKKACKYLIVSILVLALLLSACITGLVHMGRALQDAQNTGKNFTVDPAPAQDVSRETSYS